MLCFLCFRPGPKLQRVTGKDELEGVKLQADRKRSAVNRDSKSEIVVDLERCLDTRFDLDSTLVEATVIANLNCWPETLHAAKGTNLH